MVRHSAILICLTCGLAVLPCVIGCAVGSPTAEPTYTSVPTPTRQTQDDESWHECLSAAIRLWDEAEAAFLQAQERSLGDLRGEECSIPLQIMEKYILARKAMTACPLPSNPEMRQVDRLFQEAVSEQSWASDYLLLWCLAPAEEEEFNHQTMMLHWNKGNMHSHEAVELYKPLIQAPTPDPDLDYLIAVRDTVVPLYDRSQAIFDELMPLLDADDSASFCKLVPEWQSQVEDTYEALLACPEPSDATLLNAQDLWLDGLAEAAMASYWILQFCETNRREYLDYAWASLDESNRLAEEYWSGWDSYWH